MRTRTLLAALLVSAGVGLMASQNGSAAPANGTALDRAADAGSLVSQVRYYHWHGRVCYSKCYRDFVIGPRVCRTYC
jgi:hypothetical protein